MSRRRAVQDYSTLRKDLLVANALFADPQFPPNLKSLFIDGRVPQGSRYRGSIVWKRPADMVPNPQFVVNKVNRHDIEQGNLGNCWFIAGAAILATTHRDQFQKVVPLDQGFEPGQYTGHAGVRGNEHADYLADGAIITTGPALDKRDIINAMRDAYHKDYFDNSKTLHPCPGMFRFNFWWYGKWVEVVIDDYLPTNGQSLIYSSNRERPNEFWPSLLEKAYAKLRGSYEALEGGKIQDAMVDMTGGISEVIDIRAKQDVSPELYSLLFTSFKMKTLMGAGIFRPEDSSLTEVKLANGLYMGHAYSITGFRQIPTGRGTVNLLRLRNPWGQGEWTGAWSDGSYEMRQLSKQLQEDLNFQHRDEGEFWMSYEDFIYNFHEIQLCHLQPDALISELSDNDRKQMWNVTVYHDAWIRGVTAGGCGNSPNENLYWKNPQFYIALDTPDMTLGHGDDCTLIVSLMEKEKDNQSKIAVGFDVYKLKSPDLRPLDNSRAPRNALLLTRRSGSYVFYREVTKRFELKPGTYVIIPSTFNPHEEADFMLRMFTEKRAESGVLDEKVELAHRIAPNNDLVAKAFERHAGTDKRLDAFELSTFLEDVSTSELGDPLKFPTESCRSLVTLMDEDKSGFLSLSEVNQAWKQIKAYRDVFKQFDANRSNSVDTYELGTMFSKLGLPINRNVLTSIVRRYGGRDNQISLPDFVMVICKLTSLFSSFHEQLLKRGGGDTAEFSRNEFLEVTMFT